MVQRRRRSVEWLLDSALPGLAKQTLEGNIFNVVLPGLRYGITNVDQGSALPRSRVDPPDPAQVVAMSFDSNDLFPALLGQESMEHTESLSFYQVYQSDSRMEASFRRHKFIASEWMLLSIAETSVTDRSTPVVYTYNFRTSRWVKSLSETDTDNIYQEVDIDNQIIKRWPLVISGGLITGRGEEVNLFNPDQYPAAFTTAGAA